MKLIADAEVMRIGALADAGGVTPRTIRYYESLGLLPEPDRRGAHRSYDATSIERLRRIEMMKELGLTLDEVGEVLSAYSDTSPAEKRKVAEVLRRHLEEVDRKVASLRRLRKELLFRIDLCEAYAEHSERRPRKR